MRIAEQIVSALLQENDPEKPVMKPNAKEIARGSHGYTAVVRPAAGGGWNAAVVDIRTGIPIFKVRHCASQAQVQSELASDLRMMDKTGFPGMAGPSRDRNYFTKYGRS